MSITIQQTFNLEIIQQLAHEIWPIVYKDIISDEQIEYMLKTMYNMESLCNQQNSGHLFITAIKENQPVAFASFEFDALKVGTTKLHKLYVLPSFQKQKIGEQLLDFIVEEATKHTQFTISLNVNKRNSAQFFYTKLGFVIIEEQVIDIGKGYVMDDYIMQKKI